MTAHTHSTHHHAACPVWLAGMLESPLRRALHKPEKLLAGLVKPGMTVLDIGCGPGYFTLGMARLVGPQGRVIAADMQAEMLARVRAHAAKAGLLERITLQQVSPTHIGLAEPVDFALAFWMVHEVGQREGFLREIYSLVKPGGKFLIVEPLIHVSGRDFERTVALGQEIGFKAGDRPRVAASRAILLKK